MNAERFVTLLLLATGAAVYATFTDGGAGALSWVELSGFAAGLLKAALAVGLFWAFDRYVLTELDTVAEIQAGNVAYGLMLLALAVLLAATVATAQTPAFAGAGWAPRGDGRRGPDGAWAVDGPRPSWVTVARGEIGTREVPRGSNRGARGPGAGSVETYQRAVGIPPGSPWCAGFVRWVLDRAGADVRRADGTSIRSGVATVHLQAAGRLDAREVERGVRRPARGSLVVWRNGTSWTGHVGVLDWWDRRCGETVEGNTSSGSAGSQRDGDGVWGRTRCLSPGSYFDPNPTERTSG